MLFKLLKNKIQQQNTKTLKSANHSKPTKQNVITTIDNKNKGYIHKLPVEILELVFTKLLSENGNILNYSRVCKLWSNIICKLYYNTDIKLKNYIGFIQFINTISTTEHGEYVKFIDLSHINKYNLDSKLKKLITFCPNLKILKLGKLTQIKIETLHFICQYSFNLVQFELDIIQHLPFIFNLNFSNLVKLNHLSLSNLPIQSIHTISRNIEFLLISQLNLLNLTDFLEFLKYHPNIKHLKINHCKLINQDFHLILKLLPKLTSLQLIGPQINDESFSGFFNISKSLNHLKIQHTQITNLTLKAILNTNLTIKQLDITNNSNLHLDTDVVPNSNVTRLILN